MPEKMYEPLLNEIRESQVRMEEKLIHIGDKIGAHNDRLNGHSLRLRGVENKLYWFTGGLVALIGLLAVLKDLV